jgi:hypothetical protein
MATERFSTAVICMDGRIQAPAHAFIQGETRTQATDTITRPGVEKRLAALADAPLDHPKLEDLVEELYISTVGHNSEGIVLSKHDDCLGNPTEDQRKKNRQLLKSATLIERINESHGVGDIPVYTVGISKAESGLWVAKKTRIQPWQR